MLAFAPAAYARGAVRTPELASKMRWPTLAMFQQTHQQGATTQPIRLLHGRLVYWEQQGAAAALGPSPRIEAVLARGEEIARLTRRRAEEQVKAFERIFAARKSSDSAALDALDRQFAARAGREGDGRSFAEVVLGVAVPGSGEVLRYAWLQGERSAGGLDEWLARIPVARWLERTDQPFLHIDGDRVFAFLPSAAGATGPLDPAAWQDWTYATTLLALPTPLYVEAAGQPTEAQAAAQRKRFEAISATIKTGNREQALTAIRSMLEGQSWPYSDEWGQAAEWAEKHGETDLAVELRARWRPTGRCSMDRRPQTEARRYAELCYAAGRLGCFLNLQVQIMGDQFERVAYSSYGERAHATEAARLRDIGIDVERFLRGLLYRFATTGSAPRELGTWRLARSVKEAGLAPAMTGFLRAEAQRPALDPYNRLRAVETLAYLRYQDAELPAVRGPGRAASGPGPAAAIRAELGALSLTPEARAWVAAFGQD